MSKTGIFYGSSGGNTQEIAKQIASKLGVTSENIHDVASVKANDLAPYDVLLFGTSTWGLGDLQDDWEDFIRVLPAADLSDKKVALFGCGDSSTYSDTFCDAMGKIYQAIKGRTTIIGFTDTSGYSFDTSESVIDNQFVGLAIDEDNESNLSEARINNWIEKIKSVI
ncbi:MAG: flavodoxin [Candidatus Symbiothrix sp.]|jgi:flavodoxin I|nr:flavodoxin [Candidatus Symbiothrix sp.]